METKLTPRENQPPIKALVELVEGKWEVFPLADSDEHAMRILAALRCLYGC